MTVTNVIINGDFSSSTNTSATGWTGTDLETRASSVYIAGTGGDRVAEINGTPGQTTVMEQTFAVDDPSTGELNLDFALRDSGTLGVDGFKVEILDSSGNVLVTQDVLPSVQSVYDELSLSVSFPAAGNYTLRFTEIGDNADGSGAIIDNVELLICFGGDTRIRTPQGVTLARDLQIGQLVETDNGPRPIRWIGCRNVGPDEIAQDQRFSPVRICKAALGAGLPTRDLLVSRQHRILAQSPIAKRMFGQSEVLLSAVRLTDLPGIYIDTSIREMTYVHILLDDHEVLFAEDAPAESLYLGDQAIAALSEDALAEIDLIFPDLRSSDQLLGPARPVPPRKKQAHFVTRLSKNNRPLLEGRSSPQG